MKAAIYARVSTSDQSNEMQLDAIREYVNSRGWNIVAELEEIRSGAKDDRPKRREIMKLAAQRRIDVIVVWKLDRWGRSMRDLIATLEELKALDVAFCSIHEAFDFTTPQGKLIAGFLAAFAEFERSMIAERVKAGVARHRATNERWGRPPTARAKADEVKILFARGRSKRAIAEQTGISRASVLRILTGKFQLK